MCSKAIGFKVIRVRTDNNAINRQAMSQLVLPQKLSFVHPYPNDYTRPIFFIFDTVRILKCIKNNWVNQKRVDKLFVRVFPPFECSSSNNTVIFHLYVSVSNAPIRKR